MAEQYTSLDEHIRNLLKDGKRGGHPDFIRLYGLFGKEHIVEKAKTILREEKVKDELDEQARQGKGIN